jgi:hypothetical protein
LRLGLITEPEARIGDRTVPTDGNVTQHQGLQHRDKHRRPPDDRLEETLVTRDAADQRSGEKVTVFLGYLTEEKDASKQRSP